MYSEGFECHLGREFSSTFPDFLTGNFYNHLHPDVLARLYRRLDPDKYTEHRYIALLGSEQLFGWDVPKSFLQDDRADGYFTHRLNTFLGRSNLRVYSMGHYSMMRMDLKRQPGERIWTWFGLKVFKQFTDMFSCTPDHPSGDAMAQMLTVVVGDNSELHPELTPYEYMILHTLTSSRGGMIETAQLDPEQARGKCNGRNSLRHIIHAFNGKLKQIPACDGGHLVIRRIAGGLGDLDSLHRYPARYMLEWKE